MTTTLFHSACRPTVRVLTDSADIEALVPAWEGLLARSSCQVPFLTPQWLLPWWRVFGPLDGRRPAALLIELQGRLIGLALLCFRWHTYRPGIAFRRVEFWGSGENEADGICSDYLNLIAEAGQERPVAQVFAESLAAGPYPWDEFVVPLMDGTHPMPPLLAEAFRSLGYQAELTHTTTAYHVPLPPTWDEYLARLDKKDRYLIKRSERDFDAWAAGHAEFHRADSAEEVIRGAGILRTLHGERWQGAGTFRSPHFLAFHDQAMEQMRRVGALDLLWLTVRGTPVAAMYSVVAGGKVAFYQCGRATDVPKGVRPGGVLLYHAIRRAIEGAHREFDFLGGEAVYKKQLALAERPLFQLRVVRPGWRESARRLVEWAKSLWRTWFPRPAGPSPAGNYADT